MLCFIHSLHKDIEYLSDNDKSNDLSINLDMMEQ